MFPCMVKFADIQMAVDLADDYVKQFGVVVGLNPISLNLR